MRIYVDIETYSQCNLPKAGMYRYAADPSTIILCATIITERGETHDWVEDTPLPPEIAKWAEDPSNIWVAHNAGFEIALLNGPPGQKISWPFIPAVRWRDTAAQSRHQSLPASLAGLSEALGLPIQKWEEGHKVMMKLSRPRLYSKKHGIRRWTPETKPEDFSTLYLYCNLDVQVTILADRELDALSDQEQSLWVLDNTINSRGFQIDHRAVSRMLEIRDHTRDLAEVRCVELCGHTSSSREQVMAWSESQGVTLPSYQKGDLELMTRCNIPANVKEVLNIRLSNGKISTKKYDSLSRAMCPDSRLRGSLYYYGAATGRWSGRLFQPQNQPRGSIEFPEIAIEDCLQFDVESLYMLYGDLMELISSCIRGMIIAKPGYELNICDYSSIEARVVQWLAEDEAALDVFRKGLDPYKVMAANIFKVKYEDVTKPQRFVGKVAILGLGYAMGVDTFIRTCIDWGITDMERPLAIKTVTTFRNLYRRLSSLWYDVDAAAKDAILDPGDRKWAGRISFMSPNKDWLKMLLPSGRELYYFKPKIIDEIIPMADGSAFETTVIEYYGVDTKTRKYGRTTTYGGKLVENATQAVARDILAEAMLRLEQRGYPVVLTVHDEIICETPIGSLPNAKMAEIMCEIPKWAKGAPIAAEGFNALRYRK